MKNFGINFLSKYVNNASIVKYACILFLASPVLNSCTTYRVNRLKNKSYKEWKTFQWTETKRSSDKEVAEWIIYTRKVKGTNLLEYKIEGEIGSSPISCVSAFRQDIYRQANNNRKYPTYKIVDESKDGLLTYVIHNEPFPLKDTEMSVRYLFSNNEEGDAEIIWQEAWNESLVQPSKKLKRVQSFRGSWHFSKASDNQSKAVNIVQFDPKKMPKWLVNPMVTKFLRQGLENIREASIKIKS